MSTALVAIDGVMRKLIGGAPIPEGMRLYQSLVYTGRVILLSNTDKPEEQEWLELHGAALHSFVYSCPPGTTRASQANDLRREGYDIGMVVIADPEEARLLIEVGFNTVLFTHSAYAHPSWRPDSSKGVQPWDAITKQVADLARMKAADERLRAE